jgi:hypothetical protein
MLHIVTMMIACGYFAYCISAIGNIFNAINSENQEIKKKMYTINNLMRIKNINIELQNKIRKHLEYSIKQQIKRNTAEENMIIEQLNPHLKQQLIIESNKIILQQCQVFKQNFSSSFLDDITHLIEEQAYSPDQNIFDAHASDSNIDMYYILEGSIQIMRQENPKGVIIEL